ncbi:MAG TPA: hypothetical protein VK390_15730 [Propionibacteriaceae bacterium]|nr:hypothetical protein [Propionibacteriaceae bacterium]
MVVIPIWQLNVWILPSRTYPEVGGRDIEPGSVGWITPAGVFERHEEGAPDRQLDRDHVPEHVDPVNVGKYLAHPDTTSPSCSPRRLPGLSGAGSPASP